MVVNVQGTAPIEEVSVVRNGVVIHSVNPRTNRVRFEYVDRDFTCAGWYYVRVVQADTDPHGNRSQAWSSPIWVREEQPPAVPAGGHER